jgi:hypothetical protein
MTGNLTKIAPGNQGSLHKIKMKDFLVVTTAHKLIGPPRNKFNGPTYLLGCQQRSWFLLHFRVYTAVLRLHRRHLLSVQIDYAYNPGVQAKCQILAIAT